MPATQARETLATIWQILHSGREAPLGQEQVRELRRLCENIREIPGHAEFNEMADEFYLLVLSSGAFHGGVVRGADQLMERTDALRALLQ